MRSTVYMDAVMRQWLEREWLKAQDSGRGDRHRFDEQCPLFHLVPELVRLIEASPNHDVDELQNAVRLLVTEAVSDNHADVVDLAEPQRVDELVQTVVRALHDVRDDLVRRGDWSRELPSIPMCG